MDLSLWSKGLPSCPFYIYSDMNYSTVIKYNFTCEAYENVLVTQVSLASFVTCVNLEAPKASYLGVFPPTTQEWWSLQEKTCVSFGKREVEVTEKRE